MEVTPTAPLGAESIRQFGWAARWKRCLDLLVCLLAVPLLAPVMAMVSILIRLDSPGPVFYGQQRIGRHGIPFTMWKFRTMFDGSDDQNHRQSVAEWYAGTPSPKLYEFVRDARITCVGRFLRRWSLDELPQVFNVLRGEMSLVGPRPAIPYELAYYQPAHFARQLVPPGITGLWQVSGPDRLSGSEMMACDIGYVRNVSAAVDLKILALTVPALIRRALERGR